MKSQSQLPSRLLANHARLGNPFAARRDHLLEHVRLDVRAALEALRQQPGDGGLAGGLDAGDDDDTRCLFAHSDFGPRSRCIRSRMRSSYPRSPGR